MEKLRFGLLLLICAALLIACAEAARPSAGPPAPTPEPERGGGDGGMH